MRHHQFAKTFAPQDILDIFEMDVNTADGCMTATFHYCPLVKSWQKLGFSEEKIARWDERLSKVFNRGFWDGYYLGQRLGEWSAKYGSSATRVKVYAAKGIRYFSNIRVAEFQMENGELCKGDEIVITGPTTGAIIMTVDEIRVDLKPVEKTVRGERFSIRVDSRIRPSDRLYVWQTQGNIRHEIK